MVFSLERGIELTTRALQISQEIDKESRDAANNHDLGKLKYLHQEAIVLKKIMQVVSSSIMRGILGGEYDD